jgi:hypothetical protein
MSNKFDELFARCESLEEAKTLYKTLARQYHPDFGGNLADMQALNETWAQYQSESANVDAKARQRQAHSEGKKSAADFHDIDEVARNLKIKIEAALNMGLDVELCGLWVWVTGDTKPHKEELKQAGFKWAQHKTAWFYAGVPSFNRQERTLDEIRSMHGSQKFTRAPREQYAELEN